MNIINPATEEIIIDLVTDSQESLQEKINDLRKGQKEWAKLAVASRLACISKFGQLNIRKPG